MAEITYQFLTEEEKHDMIVPFLHAQERDHYAHSINKERYERILLDKTLTPQFRSRIQDLLNQTNDRLHEVTHIMEKTRAQLPAPEAVEAAKQRMLASRGLPRP